MLCRSLIQDVMKQYPKAEFRYPISVEQQFRIAAKRDLIQRWS